MNELTTSFATGMTPLFTNVDHLGNPKKVDQLANRRQVSMIYTLIDRKMTSKMFKTQVEPRSAGEWFHC